MTETTTESHNIKRGPAIILQTNAKNYGKTVTQDPCVFCGGKGHRLSRENPKALCIPCDGTGMQGGEGHNRTPVPPSVNRPTRTEDLEHSRNDSEVEQETEPLED